MGNSKIRGFKSIKNMAKKKSCSFFIKHLYYDFCPIYVSRKGKSLYVNFSVLLGQGKYIGQGRDTTT